MLTQPSTDSSAVIDRVLSALNNHSLDRLVACFSDNYRNVTPVHPHRSFHGKQQVRKNWTQILNGVPDIRAEVPRRALDGDTVWTEWEMSGSRRDGSAFLMRGVVIFGVAGGLIQHARFFLEPVDEMAGDVDAAVRQVLESTPADGGRQ